MSFACFSEFFPEIASTETRALTLLVPIPEGPPIGRYCFFELFCMDPECDCHNAMIVVCKEKQSGQLQEVTRLRFCWENHDFYADRMLDFRHDTLPDVFPEPSISNPQISKFFTKQFGNMCYENFHESPHLRRETDYARRIKKHYSLFKEHIVLLKIK